MEVAEEVVVVVVRAVCEACSLDMMEEVGRDHLLKRQAGREVKPGNKWPEGFAWIDPFSNRRSSPHYLPPLMRVAVSSRCRGGEFHFVGVLVGLPAA